MLGFLRLIFEHSDSSNRARRWRYATTVFSPWNYLLCMQLPCYILPEKCMIWVANGRKGLKWPLHFLPLTTHIMPFSTIFFWKIYLSSICLVMSNKFEIPLVVTNYQIPLSSADRVYVPIWRYIPVAMVSCLHTGKSPKTEGLLKSKRWGSFSFVTVRNRSP